MKNLTKKMKLTVILLMVVITTQSCAQNSINPSNQFSTLSAAVSAAQYVKFNATPSRNSQFQACVDGTNDGLADLKVGYGYEYISGMKDFWFSKPGYIASAVLCDENGNSFRVGNSDASVLVKFGPKKIGQQDIQPYTTSIPNIYSVVVSNFTRYILANTVKPENLGWYNADNTNSTFISLVNY